MVDVSQYRLRSNAEVRFAIENTIEVQNTAQRLKLSALLSTDEKEPHRYTDPTIAHLLGITLTALHFRHDLVEIIKNAKQT